MGAFCPIGVTLILAFAGRSLSYPGRGNEDGVTFSMRYLKCVAAIGLGVNDAIGVAIGETKGEKGM